MSTVTTPPSFIQKALVAHGQDCEPWIKALAEECDKLGVVRPVAARIGYSHSAVSAVINGSYPGNRAKIQTAVTSCLMGNEVTCPVMGKIASEKCLKIQRRTTLMSSDPTAVKLWRACRSGCPFSGVKS